MGNVQLIEWLTKPSLRILSSGSWKYFSDRELYIGSHPDSHIRIKEPEARFFLKVTHDVHQLRVHNICSLQNVRMDENPINETAIATKNPTLVSVGEHVFVLERLPANYKKMLKGTGPLSVLFILICFYMAMISKEETILVDCAIDSNYKQPASEPANPCKSLNSADEKEFNQYLEKGRFIYADRLLTRSGDGLCQRYLFDYCRRFAEDGVELGLLNKVNEVIHTCQARLPMDLRKRFGGYVRELAKNVETSDERKAICRNLDICESE